MALYNVIRGHFDAAHCLPNYNGKCANLHGHRWVVEVGVKAFSDEYLDNGDMLIDFHKMKEILEKEVLDIFDHSLVNDILDMPTSENITMWIVRRLRQAFSELASVYYSLDKVRVYESPDAYTEWRA